LDKENKEQKDNIYMLNTNIITLEHNLSHERQQLSTLKCDLSVYKQKYEDINNKYNTI